MKTRKIKDYPDKISVHLVREGTVQQPWVLWNAPDWLDDELGAATPNKPNVRPKKAPRA